ncbi:hypothetical protein [Limnospira platensis]|jgi:hypothetical protein|uniref:Uncharacterized protein n=1 Tax=Limnospira platensis NIES-46 TaxID=1236695 RepID=A0A5M3TF55_LIMPL|nr:hypothetical protein [Arthrospira platensis]MDF2209920.1 hypothetical protein [Arthrospira platensis NCB002]MDT9297752.1 hypothetical protein [Arthrospira platensis PCC 7345]MDT9309743.1 hypothetical protein [Limnospira sp. Paracas R14]QQW31937.2 hypothetical protein AP9108_06615 [Arthrospira sp. PCC 9108]BDT11636.1 hypothetical protein N39L_13590 [Arthrospira platensis NIES-39]
MRSFILLSSLTTLGFTPLVAEANPNWITVRCTFTSGENRLRDSCELNQIDDESGRRVGSQLRWSDGVLTGIEVLTINREPRDRVWSRFGLAEIDGELSDYKVFSDGGVCFTIRRNQNTICYR